MKCSHVWSIVQAAAKSRKIRAVSNTTVVKSNMKLRRPNAIEPLHTMFAGLIIVPFLGFLFRIFLPARHKPRSEQILCNRAQ